MNQLPTFKRFWHTALALFVSTIMLPADSCTAWAQDVGPDPIPEPPLPAPPPSPPRPTPQPPTPQDTPSTQPAEELPEAKEIIDACAEALGGKSAIESIESVSLKTTLNMPEGDLVLVMHSSKNGPFRLVQHIPENLENIIGFDGTTGWANISEIGYRLLDKEQLDATKEQINLVCYWDLLQPEENYRMFQTVGREQFHEQDCYKLKMVRRTRGNGPPQFGFFSVENKLMQGVQLTQETPIGAITVDYVFGDWKVIDDVNLYNKISIEPQGQAGRKGALIYTDVQINKVESSTFDLPVEVKDLLAKQSESPGTQPAVPPQPPPVPRPDPIPPPDPGPEPDPEPEPPS